MNTKLAFFLIIANAAMYVAEEVCDADSQCSSKEMYEEQEVLDSESKGLSTELYQKQKLLHRGHASNILVTTGAAATDVVTTDTVATATKNTCDTGVFYAIFGGKGQCSVDGYGRIGSTECCKACPSEVSLTLVEDGTEKRCTKNGYGPDVNDPGCCKKCSSGHYWASSSATYSFCSGRGLCCPAGLIPVTRTGIDPLKSWNGCCEALKTGVYRIDYQASVKATKEG